MAMNDVMRDNGIKKDRIKENKMNKRRMNTKGLIFTLDAVFAIIIAIGMFSAAFYYIDQVNDSQYDDQNLVKIAMSSLNALEKDRTLWAIGDALSAAEITNALNTLQIFLNSTESSICTNVTVFDTSDNVINSASKNNCNSTLIPIAAQRVFVARTNKTFYANMDIWYNEG